MRARVSFLFRRNSFKMNRSIIDRLENIRQKHDEDGDENRERAYQRAIDSVIKYNAPIRSGIDAMALPGIGKGIAWHIDQVLGTNTSDQDPPPKKKRGSALKADSGTPKAPRVPRAPRATAAGDNVAIPPLKVRFSDDAGSRNESQMPATSQSFELSTKLLNAMKDIATQVLDGTHVVLAGEYRRGIQDIKCLTFLVTEKSLPKSIAKSDPVIRRICQTIRTFTNVTSASQPGKFHSIVKFRSGLSLDCELVAVPATEWPFALIKYTGPASFWRRLQQHAESKGMRLTERGLINGALTEVCRTEADVFSRLGIAFIHPQQRL